VKKNLVALVAVLLLVAVASRMQRDPERAALEKDMKASLEALWDTHNHQAEVVEAKGGLLARIIVDAPKTGTPEWNEPFLRFVAARHPKVALAGLEIEPALAPAAQQPRVELLRRQTQSLVDGALGPGQGLILLTAIDSNETRGVQPPPVLLEQSAPSMAAPRGPNDGAPAVRRRDSVIPIPTKPKVVEECLVILPQVAEQQLGSLQAQIQTEAPCDRFRIVRLPAL